MLVGRRIIVGVTGGIAAYKAVEVCRRLVDARAHVIPVLTSGALKMVGESTFSALASEPARTTLWHDPTTPIPHVALARSADLVVVCPATARLLADYRTGRSGDLLTATLLATRAPVVLAPAMHTEMWEQASVQENLAVLGDRGVIMVGPDDGRLAGGDVGLGRMAEPAEIVATVCAVLAATASPDAGIAGSDTNHVTCSHVEDHAEEHVEELDYGGRRVLVSAGGTREPIDAVRFIGNRSSGKQGSVIAAEAAARGADVVLVTTRPELAPAGVRVIVVETAREMAAAIELEAASADVVVMAAAVADYRPIDPCDAKLKKSAGPPVLALEPTRDILRSLGAAKPSGQVLVGFAAETEDLEANARAKLAAKNLDVIVANDVSKPYVGFGHDSNEILMLTAQGSSQHIPLTTKRSIAKAVLDTVAGLVVTAETAGQR